MFNITDKFKKRFWAKVSKKESGCWEWTGSLNNVQKNKGYGQLGLPGTKKTILAHRVSYMMAFGDIPLGLFVLHKCDNRKCVNPDHLFVGTAQDNSDDMVNKERYVFAPRDGEKNGRSILKEKDVLNLLSDRGMGFSLRSLSLKYGIGLSQVHRITTKQQWKKLAA